MCDEFTYKFLDAGAIDALKDLLCGNGTKVKVKHLGPQFVEAQPFMFLSNDDAFDLKVKDPNNPWVSRVYHYEVTTFTE